MSILFIIHTKIYNTVSTTVQCTTEPHYVCPVASAGLIVRYFNAVGGKDDVCTKCKVGRQILFYSLSPCIQSGFGIDGIGRRRFIRSNSVAAKLFLASQTIDSICYFRHIHNQRTAEVSKSRSQCTLLSLVQHTVHSQSGD